MKQIQKTKHKSETGKNQSDLTDVLLAVVDDINYIQQKKEEDLKFYKMLILKL